jgi:hypothetical protein
VADFNSENTSTMHIRIISRLRRVSQHPYWEELGRILTSGSVEYGWIKLTLRAAIILACLSLLSGIVTIFLAFVPYLAGDGHRLSDSEMSVVYKRLSGIMRSSDIAS